MNVELDPRRIDRHMRNAHRLRSDAFRRAVTSTRWTALLPGASLGVIGLAFLIW